MVDKSNRVMRDGVKTQFVCSWCGSRAFGSFVSSEDLKKPAGEQAWMRRCHGSGCMLPSFSIDNDYQHFTVDGTKVGSQEEYEARVYTDRGAPDAAVQVGTVMFVGTPLAAESLFKCPHGVLYRYIAECPECSE